MMVNFLKWFFLSLVLCLALSVITAMLPGPMKKLGLFSLVLGGVVAVALSQLRTGVKKPAWRGDIWLVVVLAGMTEAGRIIETYRQYSSFQRKALAEQLEKTAGMAAMLGPELEKQFETSWLQFLQLRYSSLPGMDWQHSSASWAGGLFGLEILLACVGAAVAWRFWTKSQSAKLASH